jgi:hypothetical protein
MIAHPSLQYLGANCGCRFLAPPHRDRLSGRSYRFSPSNHESVAATNSNKIRRETVRFSFAAICDLAPKAVSIADGIPCDPYDLCNWPIRHLSLRQAEARYQFHTRSLELLPYVKVLSRVFPRLEFKLVTYCLDDGSIESFLLRYKAMRKWVVPERRHGVHWEVARRKFGLWGDAVYEDDGARFFAEQAIMDEALDHWDKAAGRTPVKRQWWNRRSNRDLEAEREICIADLLNDSSGTAPES